MANRRAFLVLRGWLLTTGVHSKADVLALKLELSLGAGASLLVGAGGGGGSCWMWLELLGSCGGLSLCHSGRQSLSNFHTFLWLVLRRWR